MRIQNSNTISITKAYSQIEKKSKFDSIEPPVKTGKNDSVTLSNTTLQLQKISSAIDNTQENRAEKINALKDSIAKGEYVVNPKKVAEKFLSSFSISI